MKQCGKEHRNVSLVQGVRTDSRKKWGKEGVVNKEVERKVENFKIEWGEKREKERKVPEMKRNEG